MPLLCSHSLLTLSSRQSSLLSTLLSSRSLTPPPNPTFSLLPVALTTMADSKNLNPEIDADDENGLHKPDQEQPDDHDNFEDDDDESPSSKEPLLRAQKPKMENLLRRIQAGKVNLRVHDVVIKGNKKTKDYLIEAELERVKEAKTMQEGVLKAINVNKMTASGCRVKIWIADWFAQLNNKMGGDLKKIETV